MQNVNTNGDRAGTVPKVPRLEAMGIRENGKSGAKKKKILFVVTQSEMGGAQRFTCDAGFWLSQHNYDVRIASGDNGKFSIFNFQLKHLKRGANPFAAALAIREIYQLIKKEQPDVLFLCSTMAGFLGSIASFFAKKFRVSSFEFQVIYRIGGWAFNDPRPYWQKQIIIWCEKLTSRFKDLIIVNSEFDLQSGLKYKIAPPKKMVKIYNGLDPNSLNFLSKPDAQQFLTIKIGRSAYFAVEKTVGTVANFYKTKGLVCLIEAIKQTIANCKLQNSNLGETKFVIIGDGKERKNLEKLIAKYNLQDTVFLLGRIPEAYQYLKAFDLFVLPSLKEGFPWVILEAMAAEIPIIATKVGAVPEILENEKSALLCQPGNSQELAKQIQKVLSDHALITTLSQNALSRLGLFSQDKMMEEIKNVFGGCP